MPLDAPELVEARPLRGATGDGVRLDGILVALAHFSALVRTAGPTATSRVGPGSGHAGSSASAPLVERFGRRASETIRR